MRTTITIDDRLLADVRRRAAERHQTVSQVIEDSVREALLRGESPTRTPFRLQGFRGGAVQPGVDLDNTVALLEHMESER